VSYEYEINGSLNKITTSSGTIYQFVYDTLGRNTQILVGDTVLSEISYRDSSSSQVERFDYGNGTYRTYSYDEQDRLISESINGTIIRSYVYDKSGNVAKIVDHTTNVTTSFRHDLIGRTIEIKSTDGQRLQFNYDMYNRLSMSKWILNSYSCNMGYIYGDSSVDGQKTGLIYGVTLNGTQQLSYQYDELTRLSVRTLNTTTPFVTEYGYLEGASTNTTTTLIKTVKNGNDTLEYTYDELGNITSVSKNGTVVEQYSYDALSQLVSATYGGNTYTYSYDNGGNITEIKKNDSVIKSYTYGNSEWKDLLTVYNGETITYDDIGNPLTYRKGMTLTWQNGRQLASVSQNGTTVATYIYDADGLRTSKTVGETVTEYYWMNGTLYGQKTGSEYIFFLYDENGNVYGFVVKNSNSQSHYYYEFNLQGDIIGIIDSSGTRVVEYTYGAWGDILSITGTMADTIGQKNPLRYRGYYYDTETGFYYLQSRYYDAEICRFLNADGEISEVGGDLLGYNMFSYCFNNPINKEDTTGNWPKWVKKAVAAVAVVAVVAVVAAVTVATAGATSVAACVAVGALKGAAIGAATGAVSGAVTSAVKHRATTGSWKGSGTVARDGAASGALSGAITGAITGGIHNKVKGICFVAGTSVLASVGYVLIEDISVGDMVWSENPETGEKELKKVVQTFVNETDELVHVHVNGEKIITTPEHPFYTPKKGWVGAIDLRAGDILVLQSGEYVIIELIEHVILETPVTVYNFEVEDFHTYYVGNSAVLVHNECGNYVSRGSTAKRQPQDLIEQLALEEVKSNPLGRAIDVPMTDPRWPASEGWIKMAQSVSTSKGKIEVHYLYNETLKIFDDFKIK